MTARAWIAPSCVLLVVIAATFERVEGGTRRPTEGSRRACAVLHAALRALLDACLEQLHCLGDALRADVRALLRRVDPGDVRLPIELRERVEELAGCR